MNWLLILVILLIAGNMVWGYSRGFLRVAYSLVEWILILVFVTWATPYVANFITEHTAIAASIESHCLEQLHQSVLTGDENEAIGETAEESGWSENTADGSGEADNGKFAEWDSFGITLPRTIVDRLGDTNEIADHLLEETGVYEQLARRVSQLAVRGLAFLIVMIVAFVLFRAIGISLNLIDKIPVIHGINRTVGVAAGFLKGLLLTWVVFALIATGAGTTWGKFLISFIYEAPVLAWLYENNLILIILINFF